jgi:predicted Zn-dependent protease
MPGTLPAGGGSRSMNRAAAILLDQANYWSAQGRPELAQQALERLLLLEPNNPDVLATAAEVSALNGQRALAEGYVARLNQMAPGTPAAARGAAALLVVAVDQAGLRQALLWQGPSGESLVQIQEYLKVFPADPEITEKLNQSQPTAADRTSAARVQGFQLLATNRRSRSGFSRARWPSMPTTWTR